MDAFGRGLTQPALGKECAARYWKPHKPSSFSLLVGLCLFLGFPVLKFVPCWLLLDEMFLPTARLQRRVGLSSPQQTARCPGLFPLLRPHYGGEAVEVPEEDPTASRSLWCFRRCFLLSCSPVTSHTNWAGKAPGSPFNQPSGLLCKCLRGALDSRLCVSFLASAVVSGQRSWEQSQSS